MTSIPGVEGHLGQIGTFALLLCPRHPVSYRYEDSIASIQRIIQIDLGTWELCL